MSKNHRLIIDWITCGMHHNVTCHIAVSLHWAHLPRHIAVHLPRRIAASSHCSKTLQHSIAACRARHIPHRNVVHLQHSIAAAHSTIACHHHIMTQHSHRRSTSRITLQAAAVDTPELSRWGASSTTSAATI
jgi:hypothetical protein